MGISVLADLPKDGPLGGVEELLHGVGLLLTASRVRPRRQQPSHGTPLDVERVLYLTLELLLRGHQIVEAGQAQTRH